MPLSGGAYTKGGKVKLELELHKWPDVVPDKTGNYIVKVKREAIGDAREYYTYLWYSVGLSKWDTAIPEIDIIEYWASLPSPIETEARMQRVL